MAIGLAPLFLACAALLGGCDATEAADAGADLGAATAADTRTDPTPAQMREIEALKAAWDAAWGNADAFAATYTEDADFVGPLGDVLAGRETIREQHAFLFGGPFAGSTQKSEIRRVVFLTGALAMVDLAVRLTGYVALPPGLPEIEPGVVQTRTKWIVVKRQGDWAILAQQMTPLPPAP